MGKLELVVGIAVTGALLVLFTFMTGGDSVHASPGSRYHITCNPPNVMNFVATSLKVASNRVEFTDTHGLKHWITRSCHITEVPFQDRKAY